MPPTSKFVLLVPLHVRLAGTMLNVVLVFVVPERFVLPP